MNNQRRKKLTEIVSDLTNVNDRLNIILGQEEESRDNLPENFIEKYEELDTNCETLSGACDEIEEIISSLQDLL